MPKKLRLYRAGFMVLRLVASRREKCENRVMSPPQPSLGRFAFRTPDDSIKAGITSTPHAPRLTVGGVRENNPKASAITTFGIVWPRLFLECNGDLDSQPQLEGTQIGHWRSSETREVPPSSSCIFASHCVGLEKASGVGEAD
jgi:hypothetical protein